MCVFVDVFEWHRLLLRFAVLHEETLSREPVFAESRNCSARGLLHNFYYFQWRPFLQCKSSCLSYITPPDIPHLYTLAVYDHLLQHFVPTLRGHPWSLNRDLARLDFRRLQLHAYTVEKLEHMSSESWFENS